MHNELRSEVEAREGGEGRGEERGRVREGEGERGR